MKAISDSTVHSRARPSQRSSTACSRCHERKVRCDVTTSSGPCSNCRANQDECVTFKAKKRGRRRKHLLPSISSAEGRVLSEPETIFYGSESQSSIIGDHGNDSGRRVSNEVHPDMSDIDIRSFDARYKLPGYVRPTPASVAQDDIDHLARKNVFALPSESFRNSCITSYIHWVHFFLPLLDLRDFLAILAHPDGSCGQVSLLLLYAVMLGGATFAPQSEITRAGYTSRFAARRDFFQRCKTLYHTNYESDRIVIVQALLLMSYWQEKHDEKVVFDSLYEESHPKLGTKTEVTLILLPVAEKAGSVSVSNLEDQLQEWPKSLPDELKSGEQDPVVDEKSRIMFLHYSVLKMFYETIMCTFYRPLLLAEQYSTDTPSGQCKQRMAHSTMLITRSFEDLEEHDLVRFLPSSGVTFLLTAATNHLMEFKLMRQGAPQQRHIRRFQDCLSYMKVLKGVHVYAKYADLFLRHVALQVGLNKYSVPAGDTNDDKLVEREGLGPWATAHTPDLLVPPQLGMPRQTVAAEAGIPVDVRAAGDIAPSPHSTRQSSGPLLPQDGSQDYMQPTIATSSGAAGYVLDDSPSCDVDELIAGSGFLSNTLWEYGWINQVTNIWPEEPWRGDIATSQQPPTS
ncbi:hypothetical protein LMH87_001587 [Akanthomyces muscarius]|uniref:Zn(2)-C6 fungal-type domain-containing protein n=1 Tax=Akanthomyces muscarius TaxID=2231603 RepID=A0A9W8Q5Z4_AKAMU|nr:hypothetical protein LMH87_001587 [Akanthomyces muscarius]KAJ4147034.1 hypothetical protein LMH87_001587 [Akanthomyces muscarius]